MKYKTVRTWYGGIELVPIRSECKITIKCAIKLMSKQHPALRHLYYEILLEFRRYLLTGCDFHLDEARRIINDYWPVYICVHHDELKHGELLT